ncbi:MAG: response regulator, partial [Endomicrobia bacterium]|nr:response regulator [Endomicrobiia bacterium]
MPCILIIDDDVTLTKFLTTFLEENDWSVYTAHSGEEALSIITEVSPDVVLLDIKLPDTEGMVLLEKIKKIDENIPVVIVSGVNEVKLAVESIKKGAFDYVTKPFNKD